MIWNIEVKQNWLQLSLIKCELITVKAFLADNMQKQVYLTIDTNVEKEQ